MALALKALGLGACQSLPWLPMDVNQCPIPTNAREQAKSLKPVPSRSASNTTFRNVREMCEKHASRKFSSHIARKRDMHFSLASLLLALLALMYDK